jgi:hypothetical protein
MVYEHFSRCFIPKDPSLGFVELLQVATVIARGDIPKLVALMLGVRKLLAMTKDTKIFHPIVVSKVFFQLISHSVVLQLWGPF